MQIKTTMGYKVIPIRLAKIEKFNNTECCQGGKKKRKLMHCQYK